MRPHIEKEQLEAGYVYAPYTPVTVATYINGEMVWSRNKWVNLWLKIKFFFKKPRWTKVASKYPTKPINPKYYGAIKIKDL